MHTHTHAHARVRKHTHALKHETLTCIAGTITNPDITATPCNGNAATPCGVDAFNLGTIR